MDAILVEQIEKTLMTNMVSSIQQVEEDIEEYELKKFEVLMMFKTTDKIELTDWTLDFQEKCLKTSKMEKQFWVAISKKNWKLLKPILEKLRMSSDTMMEYMEIGVEKGHIGESIYINSANALKSMLDDLEKFYVLVGKMGKL